MNKKIILILFLLVIHLMFTDHSLHAWSLFNRTPAMKGKVTDVTTGQSIENVVITVQWVKRKPVLVDQMRKTMASKVVITDKEGKFEIPAKTTFHFPPLLIMGSSFDSTEISFNHPLYESKGFHNFSPEEVQLMSLEQKYNKPEDNFNLGDYFYSYDRGGYFIILKKKNIYFDVNLIFSEWDRLARRFSDEKQYSYLQRALNNAKSGILEALKEEK